uniref:Putative ovule protein n=1 Tax=Solanum chacoense TaxID=4108 RepID=A0A0V0I8U8_SOLCH
MLMRKVEMETTTMRMEMKDLRRAKKSILMKEFMETIPTKAKEMPRKAMEKVRRMEMQKMKRMVVKKVMMMMVTMIMMMTMMKEIMMTMMVEKGRVKKKKTSWRTIQKMMTKRMKKKKLSNLQRRGRSEQMTT